MKIRIATQAIPKPGISREDIELGDLVRCITRFRRHRGPGSAPTRYTTSTDRLPAEMSPPPERGSSEEQQ